MVVRKGKKMNFKRIYSQIVKYGSTIKELSEDYGINRDVFLTRIQKALGTKLFSCVLRADKKNSQKQQKAIQHKQQKP